MSVRTTISLPDELKARMDAVGEPVNWSAEAAKCFERLLGEIAARKEEKDMSDVIARLKASKIENDDEVNAAGFEAGRYWAKNVASYAQLRRASNMSTDSNIWSFQGDAYGLPVHIACEILGVELDRDAAECFWEAAGVELTDEMYGSDNSFMLSFLEGADEVWGQVEDKL